MTKLEGRTPPLLLIGATALVIALVLLNYGMRHPAASHAAQQPPLGAYQSVSIDQQTGEAASGDGADSKVAVQTWTIMAAGGAAGVFLLLFFVRIALGRVPPPPPQEDAAHH